MLTTVDAIIEALGGPATTAAILDVVPSALSNWKRRGGIPPTNFLLLERALVERGKSKPSPKLLKFPEPKPKKSTSKARGRNAVAARDLD
jgi:hypothetical protein